jgi:hypothetical protein
MKPALTLLFLIAFSISSHGQTLPTEDASQADFHEFLVEQLDVLKFDELEIPSQIATYLSISKALHWGGREELSKAVESLAVEIAAQDKKNSHDRTIFNHAIELQQFEMAEEIANRPTSKFMKDRLVAARIRAGQTEAFKKEDYAVTNFHTADRVARALADAGEIDKAIHFASDLVFEADDGNDPKTVPGFVLRHIAKNEFKAGRIEKAKEYISRSKSIAGGLYYSGYCIEVDHRMIHGKLTEDVEKFASRGAAYRSHMGDELVANFIRALRDCGHYKEARLAMKHLVDPENVQHAKTYIAIAQIKKREFELARESIKLINSPEFQFLAKVQLAVQLQKSSRTGEAEALALELEKSWIDGKVSKCDERFWYLLGGTNDFSRTRKHLQLLRLESDKAKLILGALRGLAGTPIY